MGKYTAKALGATPATPPSGYVTLWNDGTSWKYITDTGAVFTFSTGITNEQVQDIVGAFFNDSSTINVTYNDAGDVISADVIESAIVHNNLSGYIANEHVNHSTVSISAGTGLTGGGDITTSRTISMPSVGTAGTYKSVTTDAQGRVTAGTNPTTLAGYGITDAQPLDSDLTAVANLATTGLVTRTATGTATTRTITASTGISISNGDGVSGNPTVTNTDLGSSAVTAHNAAGDPHTQYELEANLPADVRNTTLTGISLVAGVVSAADSVMSGIGKLQGTITAGVASFASDVRNTILTGLSVVGGTAVTAADSILVAIGKLQGQIDDLIANDNEWIELNTANTYTNTSNTTGVGVTELDLTIVAGRKYYYEATLLYQSAATTTGLAVTITSPDGASAPGAVLVNMTIGADGTASTFAGTINTLGDYVTGTGTQTANTPFVCHIKGNFPATVTGTLRITFRSEVLGSQVTISPGSTLLVREFV